MLDFLNAKNNALKSNQRFDFQYRVKDQETSVSQFDNRKDTNE